eukprot:358113-Chlamydomonas_euryale.AAC.4
MARGTIPPLILNPFAASTSPSSLSRLLVSVASTAAAVGAEMGASGVACHAVRDTTPGRVPGERGADTCSARRLLPPTAAGAGADGALRRRAATDRTPS